MSHFGQNIKQLFNQCIDLNPTEQKAVIAASEFDEEVKAKVTSMLKHHHINYGLTAAMIEEVTEDMGLEQLKAGDALNEYRLIKMLGQGGQGEVWLAKRTDPNFEQQVAIKVLKPIHSRLELNRFQAERNLLATLNHPNIAQLYGGGTHNDGRLYMVLEYIDGINILDHTRKAKLNLTQRLKLFLQVAKAVQFAHQNGIIHRDIKPNNILVDPSNQIKLLDFGIAKHVDAEVTETINERMLTMAYSSPEQLTGEAVSTVTDVYALGLVLYQLLTDQNAHVNSTSTPAEIIIDVTEKTPPLPSKCTSNEVSFKNRLQGDLDNIVMLAIRKTPANRYQSVDSLIHDVEQHLKGRPVSASGENWLYKVKKLIRRNPLSSLMTALTVASFLTLFVIISNVNVTVKAQRDLALAAQSEAEQQTQLAMKTKDFLVTLLRSASPLGSEGKEITLSQVLAQGERQLLNSADDQPHLKTTLIQTFAEIQSNLGNNENAVNFLSQSIAIGKKHGFIDIELQGIGQSAIALMWLGKNDDAQRLFKEADALFLQTNNVEAKAWHLARKATWLQESGKQESSEKMALQGISLLKNNGIDNPGLLGRFYNELAAANRHRNNEQALIYNDKSLKAAELSTGINHPYYQMRLVSRSVILMRLKRHEEAEKTLQTALKIAEKLYSKNHPILAHTWSELATFYHNKGHFNKAKNAYEHTLSMLETTLGKENVHYILPLNNLAFLNEDMGNWTLAEKQFSESLALRKKVLKNQPMRIASVQANLARLLAKMNRSNEAAHYLKLAMPVFRQSKRNNIYNQVTDTAIALNRSCEIGETSLNQLLPELNTQNTGWRKMYAQFWLSSLSQACGLTDIADDLKKQAKEQLDDVYDINSIGYKNLSSQWFN
ncbi:serine/threonine-protein kinase [Marinicella rhabdoformis]|uniref:serine/threonine-protein kinase n=1 Tax=Marinicella rhabdoformis TaxID=2580566 RepID=UPI0012AEC848|nr:serine/threonine-protein kinase [Marinicella rhabdoformis]